MFATHIGNKHFWIVGEVTDYKLLPEKGWRFFELVEKDGNSSAILAKAAAVVWKNNAHKISQFETISGQKFQNNIQVLVKVSVNFHPVRGLKLTVEDISSEFAIGQLQRQRQQTLQRLLKECSSFIRKDGDTYKTANKDLQSQAVIQRIAVVSSSAAAGYEDFLHTLEHNEFGYRFSIYSFFTSVQGELNAEALCKKLSEICGAKVPYDAVVITRGGGGQTDFLIFDHFEICKQIANFPFPVITGIGHQKDTSLADMMAHTSTKAPTMAAEFIIAHNRAFEERMLLLRNRIIIRSQDVLSKRKNALHAVQATVVNQSRDIISGEKDSFAILKQKVITQATDTLYKRKAVLQELINTTQTGPGLHLTNKSIEINNFAQLFQLQTKNFLLKANDLPFLSATIISSIQRLPQNRRSEKANIIQVVRTKSAKILCHKDFSLSQVSQQLYYAATSILKQENSVLTNLSAGFRQNTVRVLQNENRHIENLISLIRVLSPTSILKRGYAIVFHNGEIVKLAEDIPVGAEIKVRLQDGELTTITTNKTEINGHEFDV